MNASCGTSTVPSWRMRFLPSFCFFKQLLFARDVAAVALREHILAHGLDCLARDDLAADTGLHRHLEELARNLSLSFSTILRALGYALSAWMMNDSASTTSPLSMMSSLTRLLFS